MAKDRQMTPQLLVFIITPYYPRSTHLPFDLNTEPDRIMSLTYLTHNKLIAPHSTSTICAHTLATHFSCSPCSENKASQKWKKKKKGTYHLWEFSSEWISFWQLVLLENNEDIISGLFLLTAGCIMSFIMKKMTVFMRLSDWGLSLFPLILFTI